MIGIKIGEYFLELNPGTVFEMVRNSPYFNNDGIDGEYSLPISIPYTDKNYRLIGFTGQHYKTHAKQTIAATLHGGPNFIYSGSLIIDGFEKNNNQPGSLLTKGIFVFGISSFFQQVKDKNLSDLTLGGIRTFNWTTYDPYDASNGFWQHVHAVAAAPVDYGFVPIQNIGYGILPGNAILPFYKIIVAMNLPAMNGTTALNFDTNKNIVSLCPCIRLSFLLKKVLEENGWQYDGEVFTDLSFNKLFAQSFRGIYWCDYTTNVSITIFPKSTVNIDLREHVPPDYKITDFIIDLKNRYGLAFDFNTNTKTCTVSFLKNIINTVPKDFTAYCAAPVKSNFDFKERVISLKNDIDPSDEYPLLISNYNFNQVAPVRALRDRPNPATVTEGDFIFVFEENNFYQCAHDGSANQWILAGNEIGDFIFAGETEAITTGISTFATAEIMYRTFSSHNYYGYFSICNQPGNFKQNPEVTPWKLRTFLHHGMQSDRRDDNVTSGNASYPYGIAHTSDNLGSDLGGWSNIYRYSFGTLLYTINNGILDVLYKDWLAIYKNTDTRTFILNLPVYLLYQVKWQDIISIKNVRFIIKNIKFNIPYNNVVQLELLKMDA